MPIPRVPVYIFSILRHQVKIIHTPFLWRTHLLTQISFKTGVAYKAYGYKAGLYGQLPSVPNWIRIWKYRFYDQLVKTNCLISGKHFTSFKLRTFYLNAIFLQAHINQQMQSLSIFPPEGGGATEPPPPYPMGMGVASASPVTVGAAAASAAAPPPPPPSYSQSLAMRQSPTLSSASSDYRLDGVSCVSICTLGGRKNNRISYR